MTLRLPYSASPTAADDAPGSAAGGESEGEPDGAGGPDGDGESDGDGDGDTDGDGRRDGGVLGATGRSGRPAEAVGVATGRPARRGRHRAGADAATDGDTDGEALGLSPGAGLVRSSPVGEVCVVPTSRSGRL